MPVLTPGWFQPMRLGGAISVIFVSQVSLQVHYFKRDEVQAYSTSQHFCGKTINDKIALYCECCFPNCTQSW